MTAAAGETIPDRLARLNQALYDEFVRITGCTGRREFGEWLRVMEAEQMLDHLRATPPIQFPSLDLGA